MIIATGVWLYSSLLVFSSGQDRLVLFTPEEADQLRLTDEEWEKMFILTRELSIGPIIVIERPSVTETQKGFTIDTITPTDLFVVFEENGAPVDMDTLKVRAEKGILKKSLTDILKPYIRGNVLEVKGIDLPEGKFHIVVEISDKQGHKTVKKYLLKVSK